MRDPEAEALTGVFHRIPWKLKYSCPSLIADKFKEMCHIGSNNEDIMLPSLTLPATQPSQLLVFQPFFPSSFFADKADVPTVQTHNCSESIFFCFFMDIICLLVIMMTTEVIVTTFSMITIWKVGLKLSYD